MRYTLPEDLLLFENLDNEETLILLRIIKPNNQLLFFTTGLKKTKKLLGKIRKNKTDYLTLTEKKILLALEENGFFAVAEKVNNEIDKNISTIFTALNNEAINHLWQFLNKQVLKELTIKFLPESSKLGISDFQNLVNRLKIEQLEIQLRDNGIYPQEFILELIRQFPRIIKYQLELEGGAKIYSFLKKAQQLTVNGILVPIIFTLHKDNIKNLNRKIHFLFKVNNREKVYLYLDGFLHNPTTPELINYVAAEVNQICEDEKIDLRWVFPANMLIKRIKEGVESLDPFYQFTQTIFIDTDGSIYPSPFLKNYKYGTCDEPYEKILENKAKVLGQMENDGILKLPERCEKCEWQLLCDKPIFPWLWQVEKTQRAAFEKLFCTVRKTFIKNLLTRLFREIWVINNFCNFIILYKNMFSIYFKDFIFSRGA